MDDVCFISVLLGIVSADVGDWAAEAVSVPTVPLSAATFPAATEDSWAVPKMEDWSAEPPAPTAPVEGGASWGGSAPDESWN